MKKTYCLATRMSLGKNEYSDWTFMQGEYKNLEAAKKVAVQYQPYVRIFSKTYEEILEAAE